MLECYVESDFTLRQLRQCPAGPHFADGLRSAGYRQRPAQLALRGAAHLSQWAAARGIPTARLGEATLDAFVDHLSTCGCPHPFRGRDSYHAPGAYGHCPAALIAAVPTVAAWKLASLPRYIGAADVERLVAACDPTHAAGARDRAVVLLLARVGLRAGDVRALRFAHIDWAQGRFRVIGKGRCETWLPLPQEVGDAIVHYVEQFRPASPDDHIFLRCYAPRGPLPSSGPISKLVRRAIQRAGIHTPSMGAHLLRHSAATEMLRQGASLDVIGAVLRHRCIESTAHYAKVDGSVLRAVAQPWPVEGGAPC